MRCPSPRGANFAESPKGEVRRNPILRTPVNRGAGGPSIRPNGLLGTDSPEEDGGGIHPLRPREEGREVGAFSGHVVRKALVVAQEVSAGVRGSLHVERGVGQPKLGAVLRAP